MTGTLHNDVFTFMTIYRLILLRMRNVLDKICRETRNTHFIFSNLFPENCTVFEIMSKNMVETKWTQMT
jgi:hypothetical protein